MLKEASEHPDENLGRKQRHSPQLRLSTLFLIVSLLALACGWWADHARLTRLLRVQNHEIKIFSLVNSDADELTRVLSETFQGDAADPLTITADPRTNSIIARGSPENLMLAEAILSRLDQ